MKKMLLMAYVLLSYSVFYFPTTLLAPSLPKEIYVELTQPINLWKQYEPLIEAVRFVESTHNDSAYNELEKATGSFQIRPCRLNHYNTLTGKNYTLNDMFDYNIAKEVFLYFAEGKTFEKAAKSWNGSGPMTEVYWSKVNAYLQRNKS